MLSLNGDRNTEQVLRSIDGVEGTYGAFESFQGIKVVDTDYSIGYMQGIDIIKYRDYAAFRPEGNEDVDELFKKLDDGRNIMVTLMMKDSLGLKIGDKLTLDMNSGEKTYNIIGFYDSIMQNGSNAIISQKYFKTDMEQPYYNRFFVKTSKEPELVLSEIKEKFMRQGVWGNSISNMEKTNYEQNSQFMIILQAFSLLAMLIGIFGVFNNYMISFLERRRYIAIKRSIGLSKKQTLKMIFVEALTGGCIGATVGIIGAMFMLWIVPELMQTIGVPLAIHYKSDLFAASLFTGIIISVIASVSPALKTTKLDIIESIKYE
jgi:putative ABC transport system permease protein